LEGKKLNNDRELKQLKEALDKREILNKKYKRINRLNSIINPSSSEFKLETYVQRRHLISTLEFANKRFSNMMGGLYKIDVQRENEKSGGGDYALKLVYENIETGSRKDINNLSGGEGFQAALALSLGFADEIRARSGYVNVDMMFIDEGFGTLDNEKIKEDINVLSKTVGERKVGIISHVEELKNYVGERLVVTKDKNGSHVEWEFD